MRLLKLFICLLIINFFIIFIDDSYSQNLPEPIPVGTLEEAEFNKSFVDSSKKEFKDDRIQNYSMNMPKIPLDNDKVKLIVDRPKLKKIISSLQLTSMDMRLVTDGSQEYIDLLVRKRAKIESVLLTNYYWREDKRKVREYGLRSDKPNKINGNEERLYKNTFLGSKQNLYFLVDSTPEKDNLFGEAFRIRLPKYVIYGYQQTNQIYGILRMRNNVKLNVRTFEKKHSDYSGRFYDNPIILISKSKSANIMQGPPFLSKINEKLSTDFLSVHVRFKSNHYFFKKFLVQEINQEKFQEIEFNNQTKKHLNATLLSASYKSLKGKVLEAFIHFRRDYQLKTYYITVVDKTGTYSINRIIVRVPAEKTTLSQIPMCKDVKPNCKEGEKDCIEVEVECIEEE